MSKQLTRRDFLKGTAAGALGFAALGLTGVTAAKADSIYTPGTYMATVKGYSSYVTVSITVDESSITGCTVNADGETQAIGKAAAEEYAGLLVSSQDVDAVTSATAEFTMPAVKRAVLNCLDQAKGLADPLNENVDTGDDWLGEAPEIADSEISETIKKDLLIIGAGNGGMMAAATAADAGLDFIVCEQNTTVGDSRYWVGALNSKYAEEQGVTFSKTQALNELSRYASYRCDTDVLKLWINHSAEMIDYCESLGMTHTLHIEPGNHVGGEGMAYNVPATWHTQVFPDDSPYAEFNGFRGVNRNKFLEKYIGEKGYEISYQMTLVRLTQDTVGKVTGAIFTNADGKYVKVEAENTILATGGYPGNPKMVKAIAPIITDCCTANSYFGPDTGMGIKAALWAGARMDTEAAPMIFDRGLVAPGVKAGYVDDGNGNLVFPGTVNQANIGTQPHLKVNKEGKRFANESVPYDFFNFAASYQTDGVYACILDSKIQDNVIAYHQFGCAEMSYNMALGGQLLDTIEGYVNDGLMFKADTLEELAEKLGIPADALKATVERYNELCAKGEDEDFGKEAYRMIALDTAPYYGGFFGGSLLTTCDGIRINGKCQVYKAEDHKVIDGLYCVGDCSGSFFSGNYPEYYVGIAVGRTMTEGRYAVKAILGEDF